jgi:RNA polymerase sigma-70 factor (ECF subfamily)
VPEISFDDLIRRTRAGEDRAAAELVRQFEPAIRRAVRARLTDARLRRVLDSTDICQSVLAHFFARAALGQYQLDQPDQLVRLLVRMADNKLKDQVRKQRAVRRDQRRLEVGTPAALEQFAGREETPSQIVAGRELLQEVRRRLSREERFLAEQRALGRGWAEIAAEVGGKPDALRNKLSRALDRVSRELGVT